MNSLLPVGSVIEMKDDDKKYIIVGHARKVKDFDYDYICVVYPYGFFDLIDCFYFYDKDVSNVVFLGDMNY